jgi:hypothetical protein
MSDFYDYMPLDEYLAVMEKRGKGTAVSVGRKRGRSKGASKKNFPPPLTPPVTV